MMAVSEMYHACVAVVYQILTLVVNTLGVTIELVQFCWNNPKEVLNMTYSASSSLEDRLNNITFEEASRIIPTILGYEQPHGILFAIFSTMIQIVVLPFAIYIGIWIYNVIWYGIIPVLYKAFCRPRITPALMLIPFDNERPTPRRTPLRPVPRPSLNSESLGSVSRPSVATQSSHEGRGTELRYRRTNHQSPPQDTDNGLNKTSLEGTSVDPYPSSVKPRSRRMLESSVDRHPVTFHTDKSQATQDLQNELSQANNELHRVNRAYSIERDKSLCVICLDKTRELLLKPCNHYCLCATCSKELRDCPVCNERIQRTEKIFHA